jgi:hypothetical protein
LQGSYKPNGKYLAQIKANGVVMNLGYFENPAKAHEVYMNAKKSLHINLTVKANK